jgi:hypothetical protein
LRPNLAKARDLMQRVDGRRAADIIAHIREMAAGRAPRPTALGPGIWRSFGGTMMPRRRVTALTRGVCPRESTSSGMGNYADRADHRAVLDRSMVDTAL